MRNSFLNWRLRDWRLLLLDIGTHGVGEIIFGLENLLTDLLGNLVAHWLRGSCPDHRRGVSLEGDLEESQEKGGCENCLHLGWMR